MKADKTIEAQAPLPAVRQPLSSGEMIRQLAPDDEVSLLDALSVLVRRWRLVLGLPLIAAIIVAVLALILPLQYTATVAFVPEANPTSQLPSSLAGLAGQFGISLGVGSSQSPRFYATLVRSRSVSERILLAKYQDPRVARARDSMPLLTLLEVQGQSQADSLQRGMKLLGRLVSIDIEPQTNILTLGVTSRYATLSAAIANRYVDYLNDFNAKTRQSQAGERRKFVEARLAQVEADLRSAEDDLKTFYQQNRSWQQAPQLMFEEGRLRRQVDGRQEVYLTLKREYERARIEEVNDTPILTVIDHADPPVKRSYPRRTMMVLTSFGLALLFAIFLAFGAEYFERVKLNEPQAYGRFAIGVTAMRHDLRNAFQRGRHERKP